jgi:hypothetical protein
MRAHQPGSMPIDIPETVPNPAHTPAPERAPTKVPDKVPEKVIAPASFDAFSRIRPATSPTPQCLPDQKTLYSAYGLGRSLGAGRGLRLGSRSRLHLLLACRGCEWRQRERAGSPIPSLRRHGADPAKAFLGI